MKLHFLAIASLCIAGCQSAESVHDRDFSGRVVSVYQTPQEAQAVRGGNFGAAPIELIGESELKSVGFADAKLPGVVSVETVSGKRGWVVADELSLLPGVVK